jgi:hypothetical protein
MAALREMLCAIASIRSFAVPASFDMAASQTSAASGVNGSHASCEVIVLAKPFRPRLPCRGRRRGGGADPRLGCRDLFNTWK